MNARYFSGLVSASALLVITFVVLSGCHMRKAGVAPAISFTRVPQATVTDPDKLDIIQGRVDGARPGQQVVLYIRTGSWWVQPLSSSPFTQPGGDSTWINSTHLGSEYAALLVEPGYHAETETNNLPAIGNGVVVVTTAPGVPVSPSPSLQFSGYEWRIRNAPSSRGERMNPYSPANAWTDEKGALHLKITKEAGKWTCAEVTLTRSLGYGQYSFVLHDTSQLPSSVIFSMFTWDYAGVDQNHREMDIEIGSTFNPGNKNAQYVVQPFYFAANATRFFVPAGLMTHSFRWEPGKLTFQTVRGSALDGSTDIINQQTSTSQVPTPGLESVRMALYIYGRTEDDPNQTGAEVIIDKFEYLP